MVAFQSIRDEFLAIQQITTELLNELAAGKEATDTVLTQLDKLSSVCAKLCYGNGLNSDLSGDIHNLIMWCDHLDDPIIKEEFRAALKASPLQRPW